MEKVIVGRYSCPGENCRKCWVQVHTYSTSTLRAQCIRNRCTTTNTYTIYMRGPESMLWCGPFPRIRRAHVCDFLRPSGKICREKYEREETTLRRGAEGKQCKVKLMIIQYDKRMKRYAFRDLKRVAGFDNSFLRQDLLSPKLSRVESLKMNYYQTKTVMDQAFMRTSVYAAKSARVKIAITLLRFMTSKKGTLVCSASCGSCGLEPIRASRTAI